MDEWAPHTDQLMTGLVSVGANGHIQWANRPGTSQLGNAQVGEAITSFIPDIGSRIHLVLERQQPTLMSEVTLNKTGLVVDVSMSTLADRNVLIEIHPVTERLRQRQRADRADQQQAIGQMARHLAHELRNPLAGVKAGAQLITHQTQDPTISRHAEMIERGVERITTLLERFADDQTHQKKPTHIHKLLNETAELVVAEGQGGLQTYSDFDTSIPWLMADEDQLNQLFLNLMRNSAQAHASRIWMATRIEHDSAIVNPPLKHAIKITIEDDGEGIPLQLRDRLFLPLVSGRDQGSGFGLAIAQQIARAHDGLIEYEPREAGSAFIVRLPLIIADAPGEQHDI